jgi:hypothetical protein
MVIDAAFSEAIFYVSLIILAPVFYKLSGILTRYLLNRYMCDAEIVVTYKRDGLVVGVQKIKTTEYVVDQLKTLREGA